MSHPRISGVSVAVGALAIIAAAAFMSNDDYKKLVSPEKKAESSPRTAMPKCNRIQQDYTSQVTIPCIR